MSYFGSIYFKMPNGLVAGLRNVFDDGKIVKGSNMQFDRQARLSFIPLKNIKKVHVIGDNHTTLTNEEYKKEKIDDIPCKDIKAYMKPKRNATIIETYDNKLWCWGNGDYIGYSYSKNNNHVNQFLDEPQEMANIKYNDIKRICVSKRTSNIFNGTFFVMKNGTVKVTGYGNIGITGDGFKYYYGINDTPYYNVDNIFITRDCLFILYKNGDLKVYCVNNTYGQSGVGNKTTQLGWNKLNINTNNLIDICDYVPKNGYSKKLLHGEITTLFVYSSGYTLGCGSNFETLDSDGNNINCFDDKYLSDNCSIKPVKTNIDNILKIQNETILYKNNLTNNSIINKNSNNYVKDFYSYCSPSTYGIYFLDKYGSLKCLVYGDDNKALNYYTNKRDYVKKTTSSYKLIDFNNFYNVRNWTLKDNTKHEFKMELYKNSEEYLCDIPKEYVEKIDYKLGLDINCFDITVPRYINGSIEENPLYNLIKSREQIIVTDINNIKSRFILKEGSGEFTKSSGSKTFKAYSMEKCVMNNTVQISEGYYTLNKDNEYEDSGIVDTVMKDTIYDIGCIDIEAKNREFVGYNTNSIDIVKPSDIYSTTKQTDFYCIKEDVKYGDTLYTYYNKMSQPKDKEEQGVWDSSGVNIGSSNSYGENPCYLTLIYNNVISGELNINADGSYYISNEIKYGTQIININNPITYDLVSIKAIANNEIGKRNSIKHIITYKTDNSSQISFEQVDDFVKCATDNNVSNIKRYITWDSITLQYTKGDKTVVVDTVEFKYNDKEQSIDSFLTDISDTFTCTFEFDTMNNFIHCFNGELKNLTNETGFTLGKTKIGDMALGEENAINMSKVIDKLNSDTNVELTYDDITKIESKDSDENIVSGLRIKGKDDTSIINYNPLGTNIIENWDYFINNGLLSKSCEEHLCKYLSILEIKKNEWNNIQKRYSELTQTIIAKETSLTICKERIQELNAFLNTLLSENNGIDNENINNYKNSLSAYNDNYTNIKNEINNLNSEKDKLEEELFNYSSGIKKIDILDENGNNIFTYSDIQELSYLQNIEEVSDDYFTDGQQLYEYYKKQLEYKSKGLIEFTTTTNNMMRYYMYGGNLIKLGNIYELDNELKNVFKTNRVKLLQYSYYPNKYENGSIEGLVFSNKEKIIDELKLFRKNTQIKTQNNEKEICSLTSKIAKLEDKINQKQDITIVQNEINNKIIYGNLIESNNNYSINFNYYEPSKESVSFENFLKNHYYYDGEKVYKANGWSNSSSSLNNGIYSTIGTFNNNVIETKTPEELINCLTNIISTTIIPLSKNLNYIPLVEAYIEDNNGVYHKLPYVETDNNNFEGALPIKSTTDLTVSNDKITITHTWNRINNEPIPNKDLKIKYYVFDYGNNIEQNKKERSE